MADVMKIVESLAPEERIALLVGAGVSKRVPGAAGETRPVERLGIPPIILSDGPAALRILPLRFGDKATYYSTAFPNAIALASSWNLELVERVGRAIGEEAREYGVDVLLAPALNIHRIPLCGRNFEYFSEDPLLSGEMAGAYARGVQSTGVAATLKHFVANDQETNRHTIDTIVSERALREIYLRAFEIAIEKSGARAVMAAYNKLNGKYCVQNPWLLTEVLRREWGYEGLVMTDWGAGDNPVEQIKAGIDLIMPGEDKIVQQLVEAYRRGEIDESIIRARASKVLELILNSPKYKGYKPSYRPDLESHAKLAYEAAVEGAVLLKNEGALPLPQGSRIALLGRGSYMTLRGGLGSGFSYARYTVSIYEGLKERGLLVDEEIAKLYRKILPLGWIEHIGRARERAIREGDTAEAGWILMDTVENLIYTSQMFIGEDSFGEELINKAAERNDAAVITISRISGEGSDRAPLKGDFYLRDDEMKLLSMVSAAFHRLGKKVIAILNVPSPIEVASWRDLVDAILVIWMPGQEAGRAVADLLLGRATPSGKLPLTWPRDLYENPATRTWPGEPKDNPERVIYEEGIYVGYRYYDTFAVDPAYEFGYGLSYTKFEYRDLSIVMDGHTIKIEFRVKNVGSYPGKEVPQIYVRAPRGRLEKPYQELKGFYKTRLLMPQEEEQVTVKIPVKYLASFGWGRWVVERGVYEIRVGASSRDIRLVGYINIDRDLCYNSSWKSVEC